MDKKGKTIEEADAAANNLIAAGASAGAIGTAGALITGAICPLCIIATPILLGVGLVKRINAKRKRKGDLDSKMGHGNMGNDKS